LEEIAAVRGSRPGAEGLNIDRILKAQNAAVQAWHLSHASYARNAVAEAYSLPKLQLGRDLAMDAAFSHNGSLVLTADRALVEVWGAPTGERVRAIQVRGPDTQQAPTYRAFTAKSGSFSLDGSRILSGGMEGVRVWETNSGKMLGSFPADDNGEMRGVFSPDGTRVLSYSYPKRHRPAAAAHIWDALDGSHPQIINCDGWVVDAAFSHDGTRIVTVCGDGAASIWDAASGQRLLALGKPDPGPGPFVVLMSLETAVFSGDDTRILGASGNDAAVWDAKSGSIVSSLHFPFPGESAEFSPDLSGSRILQASLYGATIYESQTGRILLSLGRDQNMRIAHFSADGRRVVTVAFDDIVQVWDAASGIQLAKLYLLCGPAGNATLSNDGRLVLASSSGACPATVYEVVPSGDVDKLFP
jgi:WD40 repeat protein